MDEDAGVQQVERARGDCAVPVPSMGEAQAAAKHAAALRALHDASQVVAVLSDLLHEVQASAEREVREAFVAGKREEARRRAQVELLKDALRVARRRRRRSWTSTTSSMSCLSASTTWRQTTRFAEMRARLLSD